MKNHPFYYLSPCVYAIGTAAEQVFFGVRRASLEQKKVFILRPYDLGFIQGYRLTNSSLFELESEYIYRQNAFVDVAARFLMTLVYFPLRMVRLLIKNVFSYDLGEGYGFPQIGMQGLYLPGRDVSKFDLDKTKEQKWSEFINLRTDVFVRKTSRCRKELEEEIGISEKAWYVCLHVRESGFRGDAGRREYRNANIHNYLEAIRYIVEQGGYVVRMGDHTMTPLPDLDGVIDYPFTEYKSDLNDFILLEGCAYFIGCQSGIFDVAKLLGKRTLLVNMYNWTFGVPLLQGDRGILKHIYCGENDKFLSIQDILESGWELQNTNGYVSDNYKFYENNSEEILSAVKEFMGDDLNDGLQQKAESIRREVSLDMINNNRITSADYCDDFDEVVVKYRFCSQVYGASGLFSYKYLSKNWSVDQFDISTLSVE